ncbi:MAG: hypothetical protein K0S56_540 [Microvirga sp.]|jgi:uncharacterized phiE125 gp8 family phage protein|nr:hypothetical protein [Microvirga sp.]
MNLRLVTAPTAQPVTLVEAKAHLRVDHADEDDLISALIETAVGWMDAGWLGRALMPQTWEMVRAGFGEQITIPLLPLISVDSIKYVSTDGVLTTLAADQYAVYDRGKSPSIVAPAYALTWPSVRAVPDAVTIQFQCGYADAASVPPPVKHAIKLIVGHLYQNRESVTDKRPVEMPMGVDALLGPFRMRHAGGV